MTWDPADDPRARVNRAGKVETLTAWCQARGLGPGTVHAWDEVTRRRAARAAAVNPPRATSPTWTMVTDRLTGAPALADGMGAEHRRWCAGCPLPGGHSTGSGDTDPSLVGAPPATGRGRTCSPGPSKPEGPDLDVHPLHATGLATPSDLPTTPTLGGSGPVLPKGWAALVALGPVDPPQPCTVPGPDGPCGAPAVTRTMGATGSDVWRCAVHPPAPGEWGHGLDHTPSVCRRPARCYCGRCDVSVVGR